MAPEARAVSTLAAPGVPLVGAPPPPKGMVTFTVWDEIGVGAFPLGAAILMAGEPGAGKSVAAMILARAWSAAGRNRVAWFALEEGLDRVFERADRLGALLGGVMVYQSAAMAPIVPPGWLWVVDPIQGWRGSAVAAMQEAAEELLGAVRTGRAASLLALCRVDKRGRAAGPRDVAHLFDAELYLERRKGEKDPRTVRAAKNRFGPCGEWELTWPARKGAG